MPELPEVEIARRNLQAWTTGARLVDLDVADPARFDAQVPLEALRGRVIGGWGRRGKYLLGALGDATLVSHLGMTGKWVALGGSGARAHVRVTCATDRAVVGLVDPRRFGHTWVLPADHVDAHPRLASLGPDALTEPLAPEALAARVGRSKTALKSRLLNQKVIAGLGNIAVVEVAWRAKIHPHTPCSALSPRRWEPLAAAILAHLEYVLEVEEGPEIVYLGDRGATNPFLVYGREDQPCPRCETPIARSVLSGRPTFSCPSCQPL